MIPDFCPACDAADKPFKLVQRPTEQDFLGETFRVTSPALQCRHCGFGMLGPGHLGQQEFSKTSGGLLRSPLEPHPSITLGRVSSSVWKSPSMMLGLFAKSPSGPSAWRLLKGCS